MKTRRVIISLIILLVFVLLIVLYGTSKTDAELRGEFAFQEIKSYTTSYFRFCENVNIEENEEGMALSITFVPEVGSIPIKEVIYQQVAWYALQIHSSFPEVKHFTYAILWDENNKQEAMKLVLDAQDVENLEKIYYREEKKQSNGLETSYKDIFSTIIETEIVSQWREQIDAGANLP